jgi:O-methyltransferase involved in polyketide biosynthesis
MNKHTIRLGSVQETLLLTLWARATEASKPDPVLNDPKSVEILQQIDYDFDKFNTAKASQLGVCLRGTIVDGWVKDFLQAHPDGIVVEIGSGLNTRFERVDNDRVCWFDLDLPDSMDVRKQFFPETERRKAIAASVLDSSWIDLVKSAGNKPIMFVSEGVLMSLTEPQVQQVFALLVEHFPGCYFAFDSMSPFMVKNQKQHDAMKYFSAKFQWGIQDIQDIQNWDKRYKILEVTYLRNVQAKYYWRMGWLNSLLFLIPPFNNMYRLSKAQLG